MLAGTGQQLVQAIETTLEQAHVVATDVGAVGGHLLQQRLDAMAKIANGIDAGHARATLEGVQVALQPGHQFAVVRCLAQAGDEAVAMVEQVLAFFDEDVDQLAIQFAEVQRAGVDIDRLGVGVFGHDGRFDCRDFGFGFNFNDRLDHALGDRVGGDFFFHRLRLAKRGRVDHLGGVERGRRFHFRRGFGHRGDDCFGRPCRRRRLGGGFHHGLDLLRAESHALGHFGFRRRQLDFLDLPGLFGRRCRRAVGVLHREDGRQFDGVGVPAGSRASNAAMASAKPSSASARPSNVTASSAFDSGATGIGISISSTAMPA